MTKYTLSFDITTDIDPSTLLDTLQGRVQDMLYDLELEGEIEEDDDAIENSCRVTETVAKKED